MKKWIGYIVIGLLLHGCMGNNALPSLKETYFKQDANPFGGLLAYQQLNLLFAPRTFTTVEEKFNKAFSGVNDTGTLYVNVSRNYYTDDDDTEAILRYVAAGNTAFIAASSFDTVLLSRLRVKQAETFEFPAIANMVFTGVKTASPPFNDSTRYKYFYMPFRQHFQRVHPQAKVLGINDDGMPNFIVVYYQLGRFYLHCEPRIFSNYFLMQPHNYQYLQQLFAYVPGQPAALHWDDYYNKHNTLPGKKNKKGAWDILFSYPAMAWATSLALAMLLLFVLFARKRRQRIVPEIVPAINTSVAFTQTVSQLYLQQHNNRDIADKQINYLMEHIRSRYFISTATLNQATLLLISRKSGFSEADTQALFTLVASVQAREQISDDTLLTLNQYIEKFYQNHNTDGRKPV
jgi:hypothetical protein